MKMEPWLYRHISEKLIVLTAAQAITKVSSVAKMLVLHTEVGVGVATGGGEAEGAVTYPREMRVTCLVLVSTAESGRTDNIACFCTNGERGNNDGIHLLVNIALVKSN